MVRAQPYLGLPPRAKASGHPGAVGGGPTFVEPATTTTEHCYERNNGEGGFAYLQRRSMSEMVVVTGDGVCPASLPSDFKIVYH
jgi:hypothetical protein